MSSDKTYFATYRDDEYIVGHSRNKLYEMCSLLNAHSFDAVNEIVVDETLTSTNGSHMWESMIKPIKGCNMTIYTTGPAICCEVTPEYRKEIINGLVRPIPDMPYYGFMLERAKYYAIPAIKGYEDIAVLQVPRGVARTSANTNEIIAPFTKQLGSKTTEMSKEMFVSSVMEDVRFERIIAYVKENCAGTNDISADRIRESYCKLIEEFYDTRAEETK